MLSTGRLHDASRKLARITRWLRWVYDTTAGERGLKQAALVAITFCSSRPSNHQAAHRRACKPCSPTAWHNCPVRHRARLASLHFVPPRSRVSSIRPIERQSLAHHPVGWPKPPTEQIATTRLSVRSPISIQVTGLPATKRSSSFAALAPHLYGRLLSPRQS